MTKRPTCPRCKGTGKILAVSFLAGHKDIDRSCSICRGKGTLAMNVDIYDVLDWLRVQGKEGTQPRDYATRWADELEKKWGIGGTEYKE